MVRQPRVKSFRENSWTFLRITDGESSQPRRAHFVQSGQSHHPCLHSLRHFEAMPKARCSLTPCAEHTMSDAPPRRFVGGARARAHAARISAESQSSSTPIEQSIVATAIEDAGAPTVPLMRARANAIPDVILHNEALNQAIKTLPSNYNFEIHKTVYHVLKNDCKRVALQMPEGLHMFACIISDIISAATGAEIVILCDVTYGACCVDDFTASALGCDLLVHYGHSCLVPIDVTSVRTLYIFVDIQFDIEHFLDVVQRHIRPSETGSLALVSTIQFAGCLRVAKAQLAKLGYKILVPQAKPLSGGEILGCTSPRLRGPGSAYEDVEGVVYIGDGRFHLESVMLQNPGLPAYRFDPYAGVLSIETYDHERMREVRTSAIVAARKARRWGVIIGTLGRQANPHVVDWLRSRLGPRRDVTPVCMSEISPARIAAFSDIDAWVQIACPRLSIDWGAFFARPVLTPYEAALALGHASASKSQKESCTEFEYKGHPMDFYSTDAQGPWAPGWWRNKCNKERVS